MKGKLSQKDKIMLLVLLLVLIGFGAYMLPSYGISAILDKKEELTLSSDNAKIAYEEEIETFKRTTGTEYTEGISSGAVKLAIQKKILTAKFSATQENEYLFKSYKDYVAYYQKARNVYSEYVEKLNFQYDETQVDENDNPLQLLDEEGNPIYKYFNESEYNVTKDSPSEGEEGVGYNVSFFLLNGEQVDYCFRNYAYNFKPIEPEGDLKELCFESKTTENATEYYSYNRKKTLYTILDYWSQLLGNTTASIADDPIRFNPLDGATEFSSKLYMTLSEGLGQYDIGICTGSGEESHPYDASDPEWQNGVCVWCGAPLVENE